MYTNIDNMYLVSWDLFLATRVTLDWDFGTLCIVCLTKHGNEVFFKTLQKLSKVFYKTQHENGLYPFRNSSVLHILKELCFRTRHEKY